MIHPQLDDPDLAYEAGVHLGDGSLAGGSSADYRYLISGNRENETQYYTAVLAPLIGHLYSVLPTISFQDNSVYLRVYSKELVLFKHCELGFPIGRKRELKIPAFTKSNRLSTANVLSGLYDTDGCVKIRHNKSGDYPRISFAQKHEELVKETRISLGSFGITSSMYQNDYFDPRSGKINSRWFLDINGFRNFDLFMDKIGTRSEYVSERMKAVEAFR
jgi:intein/homing endonuclease